MILLVGPSGVGKTLLLKQLEETSKSFDKKARHKDGISTSGSMSGFAQATEIAAATVPTIGTNLMSLNFGKKKAVDVREVGGSMGPLWKNYYKDAAKIIYVIDISNPHQVSSATCRLLEMLNSRNVENTPCLLLLNKIDNFSAVSHTEMKSMLMLDDILVHGSQPITSLETSAKYGTGIMEVIDWVTSEPDR